MDKVEQAKCEEHFESQGHSDYETKRLIMKNCPCHYNCYNSGCANCGGWECPNSDSHIDAATGKDSNRELRYLRFPFLRKSNLETSQKETNRQMVLPRLIPSFWNILMNLKVQ